MPTTPANDPRKAPPRLTSAPDFAGSCEQWHPWASASDAATGPARLVGPLLACEPLDREEVAALVASAQQARVLTEMLALGVTPLGGVARARTLIDHGASCRAQLVAAHLPLVQCAGETEGGACDPVRLEAALGELLRAVDQYDPRRGEEFTSWATARMLDAADRAQTRDCERLGTAAATGLLGLVEARAVLTGSPLTEVERSVAQVRFGLDGKGPRTLAEAADLLGLTRTQVRATEVALVSRLRQGRMSQSA